MISHSRAIWLWCLVALGSPAIAAGDAFWEVVPEAELAAVRSWRTAPLPKRFDVLRLDVAAFERRMLQVVATVEPTPAGLELPLPGGKHRGFRIRPSTVLPKTLADRYPGIHSYAGEAFDDPAVMLRLDWLSPGLHAAISTADGMVLIEPFSATGGDLHLVFYKHDAQRLPWHEGRSNHTGGAVDRTPSDASERISQGEQTLAIGDKRRTYRIAIAADSEYSQFFGGTKKQVLASIVRAVNRLNGIYETELSVTFQLVADNDTILFLDPANDPYKNLGDVDPDEKNQEILDQKIGRPNYDLGHLFDTDDGGVAVVASLCRDRVKAMGNTGSLAPDGDAFWVDFVAHEIGHQMGAEHTFNGALGACEARDPDSSYEIGSGVTIMGYAGLCRNDNIQRHSMPYFHARSLAEISENIVSGRSSSCGVVVDSGNAPPSVEAGDKVFNIPKGTPFILKGQGSDPDGDRLTYSWEEFDRGERAATVKATEAQSPKLGTVPLFRSFGPGKDRARIFPQRSSILGGQPDKGEVLPGYSRPLRFRLAVRDGKGGVAISPVRTVNVVGEAGPLVTTKPAAAEVWSVKRGKATVSWGVAGTDRPPISCQTVNVGLSLDDGESFAPLASRIANDGEQRVDVPGTPTREARVRITCVGNIFTAISPRFSIE